MSISSEILRLQSAKTDIKTAIEAKEVTVPSSATIDTYADYVSQISGGSSMPSKLDDATFDDYGKITSATIKSGETSISNSAYYGCSSISSITIPNSVTSIGAQAFRECNNLTSITIPDSVTSIGDATFFRCGSLTSCTIGSGITTIRFDVFNSCDNLTSLTIQATTPPTLFANAFANTPIANGIGHIYVPEESVDLYKASSGFSAYSAVITCIGCGSTAAKFIATYEDGSVMSAECDSTSAITENDIQDNTGEPYLWEIRSVVIGDCVTSISDNALIYTPITSITIGNNVTDIGNEAFYGCQGLTSITVNATTPPTLGSRVFDDTNDCPIYIPMGTLSDYENDPGWNEYSYRLQEM